MQEYKSELKHLEEQVKQLDGELQRAEMQLARIESLGKVPTKEELDRILQSARSRLESGKEILAGGKPVPRGRAGIYQRKVSC